MAAHIHNILIEQGATYYVKYDWRDSEYNLIDLTGFTARMQVRATKTSDDVLITATTENGKIVLGDEEGTVEVTIPATETAELTVARAVYDLELISAGGFVYRFVQGDITVSKEVTR